MEEDKPKKKWKKQETAGERKPRSAQRDALHAKNWKEHLPPWDGQNHILTMSVSVNVKGDVKEQMLFAEYLTKWLVGMVAGWVDDSVVNNVILVLIGEQGSYKTTWSNYLLPPELSSYFYTKTNAQRMGRDDLLTLAQYGLVCCEELDTMRPSELNQLKAAVTMPSIDERAAYAHYHEHRPHIASFCDTGNIAQKLSAVYLGRAFVDLGFQRVKTNGQRGYIVVQRTAAEIQETQRAMAAEAESG